MTIPTVAGVPALHVIARVGTERFAFPVSRVEEAVDAPTIAWVPNAPSGMTGQLRYRERTISAWDAGWAFGVRRTGGAGVAIVLRGDGRRFAVIVDDVDEITPLDEEAVQAVPPGSDPGGLLGGVSLSRHAIVSLVHVEVLAEVLAASDTAPGAGSAE